jgi:hypothetical protein
MTLPAATLIGLGAIAPSCRLCRRDLTEPAPALYDGYPIDRECAEALHAIKSVSLAWVHPNGPAAKEAR